MKKIVPDAVNKGRITKGLMRSGPENGMEGAFILENGKESTLLVISGVGYGWEHVSVSAGDRIPTWDEMCNVKNLFFEGTELDYRN